MRVSQPPILVKSVEGIPDVPNFTRPDNDSVKGAHPRFINGGAKAEDSQRTEILFS